MSPSPLTIQSLNFLASAQAQILSFVALFKLARPESADRGCEPTSAPFTTLLMFHCAACFVRILVLANYEPMLNQDVSCMCL